MKTNVRAYIGIVIVALLFAVAFVPVNTSAQAPKPEWEEGDEWSMGYQEDLTDMFAPALDQYENLSDSSPDVEEFEYSMDGEVGFYQIYKITEVSDTEYTMDIEAGGGIHLSGDFSVTGQFDKEGTYTMDETIPKETKTMSGNGEFHFTQSIEGTAHFTKSDLAVKDLEVTMTVSASGSYTGDNIPANEYDWENETQIIKYEDFSGSISGDITATLNMEFSPALDIFDFPVKDGEHWTAKSNATISGTYDGQIDATGLPESMEEDMEQAGYSFPINLADLETGSSEIHDGVIEETTAPISIPMRCTGTEDVVLEDGTSTTAYIIQFGEGNTYANDYKDGYSEGYNDAQSDDYYSPDYPTGESSAYQNGYYNGYDDAYYNRTYDDTPSGYSYEETGPSFKLLYSADEGFIVSQEISDEETMSGLMDTGSVKMEPQSEDEARESMESLQASEDSGGFLSELFSPPFLYIIIGIIAAVAFIAVLLIKKGGKEQTGYYQYNQQYQQQPPQQQPPQQQQQQPQQQQGYNQQYYQQDQNQYQQNQNQQKRDF